jgi:hypothetical protein
MFLVHNPLLVFERFSEPTIEDTSNRQRESQIIAPFSSSTYRPQRSLSLWPTALIHPTYNSDAFPQATFSSPASKISMYQPPSPACLSNLLPISSSSVFPSQFLLTSKYVFRHPLCQLRHNSPRCTQKATNPESAFSAIRNFVKRKIAFLEIPYALYSLRRLWAAMEEILTTVLRPFGFWRRGRKALVTRYVPRRLTSKVRQYSSSFDDDIKAAGDIYPAQFTKISSLLLNLAEMLEMGCVDGLLVQDIDIENGNGWFWVVSRSGCILQSFGDV